MGHGIGLKTILVLTLVSAPALAADSSSETASKEKETSLGRKVEDFAIRDHRGNLHSLKDYADSELIVFAFLGTECPLAKLYSPRLVELAEEFEARGVTFLGVNSNSQDDIAKIAAYAQAHAITFPILKDVENDLADVIGAERTPEIFVLDKQRTVRYQGRIDDQYEIGIQRSEPKQRYLAAALTELLDGQPVSTSFTKAVGCIIGRAKKPDSTGDVTYHNQIARILNRRCVECHRDGQIAPFALVDYVEVVGWSGMIREVISEGRMPPWYADPKHGEFRNDTRLTDEEKAMIFEWIANDCPEGDPADHPPDPEFAEGWRIPEPDQIVYMDDESFTVPADGVVDYQYFKVDPGFEEDKYIVSAEARPGNAAVVHHIIVFVVPPGEKEIRQGGSLIGYAPGMPPLNLHDGVAVRVPAGSKLVFEMHYTPNGSVQEDRSYVGFNFVDREQVKKVYHGHAIANGKFKIPPHADNHKVVAEQKVDRDRLLVSMTPHMHLRGKAFRYEAVYPDGTREILLDVPRYDFNWQLRYELAEPKLLPEGTQVVCTAWYDNSAGNPANPDPTQEVRWGEQSWDEMMIGFVGVIDPD